MSLFEVFTNFHLWCNLNFKRFFLDLFKHILSCSIYWDWIYCCLFFRNISPLIPSFFPHCRILKQICNEFIWYSSSQYYYVTSRNIFSHAQMALLQCTHFFKMSCSFDDTDISYRLGTRDTVSCLTVVKK